MFSYYNISLSLFFNKSFAEPYFSTTSRRFCSFKDAHVPVLTVTDAICLCRKARIILQKSLYEHAIKAFPRAGKAFSVVQDTVLYRCEAHNMPVYK